MRYLVYFMILLIPSQRSRPGPDETTNEHVDDVGEGERKGKRLVVLILRPDLFFFFISLIADGSQRCYLACGH